MAEKCWNCSEESARGNFCANCGAPVDEFEPSSSPGFLTRQSNIYLRNILNGEITRRDSTLDEGVVESLEDQLEQDICKALGQLAAVMLADEEIVVEAGLSEIDDIDLSADPEAFANQLGKPGLGYALLVVHALRRAGKLDADAEQE